MRLPLPGIFNWTVCWNRYAFDTRLFCIRDTRSSIVRCSEFKFRQLLFREPVAFFSVSFTQCPFGESFAFTYTDYGSPSRLVEGFPITRAFDKSERHHGAFGNRGCGDVVLSQQSPNFLKLAIHTL